jgi:uncharacterized membrane protein HdeD (DUF308 family)
MLFSDQQWIVFGKTMMLFCGLILVLFPVYTKEDFIYTFMKLWVMSYGIACIFIFFKSRKS